MLITDSCVIKLTGTYNKKAYSNLDTVIILVWLSYFHLVILVYLTTYPSFPFLFLVSVVVSAFSITVGMKILDGHKWITSNNWTFKSPVFRPE